MNRKIYALFFLLIICSETFINTSNAAAAVKAAPKKPARSLVEELDKQAYLKNNNDLIKDFISPVANPFQDGSGGLSMTEFFKAMIVGCMSLNPVLAVGAIFVDAIWSGFIENNTADKNDAVTQAYIQMVNEIVDQKIMLYDQSILFSEYTAVNAAITSFKDSVVTFNADKQASNAEDVRRDYDYLELALRSRLDANGAFRKKDYELSGLPVFALAATIYFMIQADVQRNGRTWGFSNGSLSTYQGYANDRLPLYIQHVKTYYQSGFDKVVGGIAEADRDLRTWNNVNRYRRTMIPQVMDYAAIWWTFNSTIFPASAYGERVRYVYSDVIGQPINSGTTPNYGSYYDPSYKRLIEMADYLERERYRGELLQVKIQSIPLEWMYSIQPTYYDESKPNKQRVGLLVGNPTPDRCVTTLFNMSRSAYPTLLYAFSDVYPQYVLVNDKNGNRVAETFPLVETGASLPIEMWFCANRNYQVPEICNTYYNNGGHFNAKSYSLDGHKIGDLIGWNKNTMTNSQPALDAFHVGFVPEDVYGNNLILKDVSTIIDAQKAMKQLNTKIYNDFVLPGVHTVTIFDRGSLTFKFDSQYKAKKTFKIFIKVHHTQTTDSEVRLLDGPTGSERAVAFFKVKANTRDQLVYPDPPFEILLNPSQNNNTFIFKAFGNGVQLQSIIFIPKK